MITPNEIILFLSGQPVMIKDCNIALTQPKIKDIAIFGEEEFLTAVQMLINITKVIETVKSGNSELEEIADFQILLIMLLQDKEMKNKMLEFFQLIFPEYEIIITEQNIQFSINEQIVGMINVFNFEQFRDILSKLFVFHSGSDKETEYVAANDKAQEIIDKIKKGRQKVNEIKASEGEVGSLFGSYVSILAVGMSIDINILFNYTPFQIYDTFMRYWAKTSSDFYQKVSTTPLMDVSKIDKPEEWTKQLYK